jgi:nitrate reductase gamma subunit
MHKKYLIPLVIIVLLWLIPYYGVKATGLTGLFGIAVPYLGFLLFVGGFIYKVLGWARSTVPFSIPTTCGQQKSLPWIKANNLETPFTKGGVFWRMVLEVFLFRSLFRNTVMSVKKNAAGQNKLTYSSEPFLWLAGLAFHYSFLVVTIRHLRFFLNPVPLWLQAVENLDGFFRVEFVGSNFAIGLPGVMVSGLVLLAAGAFLLIRRFSDSKVRYISLPADYFPLYLILAIAFSGGLMRYISKVDIVSVKELTMGFASFQPVIPQGIGPIFFVHLFLVSFLFAYIPFSKLMHLGGVFLSPTRNLTADTRQRRHINPWNPDVKPHTYEEYEEEFREKMLSVGLPVDKKE